MKTKWLIIAALFPLLSFSQDKHGSGFNAIVSTGVVAGESAAKPLVQVAAGLNYDRYFMGVGLGLDPYYFKSIPLFADWRINFGKTRLAFVYANGGYNLPYNNKNAEDNFFKSTDRFNGGFYMDLGMGYRIRLSSYHRLLFSAGYSRKDISNKVGYTYPCLNPPCDEQITNYRYSLGRIVTKLSWEFGK
ncbi:MAG TPA: hypothetical protein VI461_02860 [Chitinophagaceae bacterium]|nr:hypothetical protein [Chitinophagaceae bacterium]